MQITECLFSPFNLIKKMNIQYNNVLFPPAHKDYAIIKGLLTVRTEIFISGWLASLLQNWQVVSGVMN